MASRFDSAAAGLEALYAGGDATYLRAELAWRRGQLPEAVQQLQISSGLASNGAASARLIAAGVPDVVGSGTGRECKCWQLLTWLRPLAGNLRSAEMAFEDGGCFSLSADSE